MPKKPDLTITLYVDYMGIYNAEHDGPPVSQDNPCCNLGQPTGTKNKDVSNNVNKGNTVLWNGQAIAGSYSGSTVPSVNIFTIYTDDGNDVFSDINISGNPKTTTGTVETTIDANHPPQESYSIWFNIYIPGVYKSKPYRVDPKMIVNP